MMMKEQKNQTFNDGIVKIYGLKNIAEEGLRPVVKPCFKEVLRFRERTVGITRYNLNLQNNAKIDRLLRVQTRRNISTQDIAVVNGEQYVIKQVQYIENLDVMDLSLERVEQNYDCN